MVEMQCLEPRDFLLRQSVQLGGDLKSDTRQVCRRVANSQRDRRRRGCLGRLRGKVAFEGNYDFLLNLVSLRQLRGVWNYQRRAVGFEGRVCPVALVLHLEDFSLECDARPTIVDKFMAHSPQVLGGLMRRDELGKTAFCFLAASGLQQPGPARGRFSVQHAEADAVAFEVRQSLAIKGIFHFPVGRALDRSVPV